VGYQNKHCEQQNTIEFVSEAIILLNQVSGTDVKALFNKKFR
jgi:hypothetical protein